MFFLLMHGHHLSAPEIVLSVVVMIGLRLLLLRRGCFEEAAEHFGHVKVGVGGEGLEDGGQESRPPAPISQPPPRGPGTYLFTRPQTPSK